MPDDEDMIGDEGEILSISLRDAERLRHCCARASMIMVGLELEQVLATKETESLFVSEATLRALRVAMSKLDTEELDVRSAKRALMISNLASSLSWAKNVEIGPERCDA